MELGMGECPGIGVKSENKNVLKQLWSLSEKDRRTLKAMLELKDLDEQIKRDILRFDKQLSSDRQCPNVQQDLLQKEDYYQQRIHDLQAQLIQNPVDLHGLIPIASASIGYAAYPYLRNALKNIFTDAQNDTQSTQEAEPDSTHSVPASEVVKVTVKFSPPAAKRRKVHMKKHLVKLRKSHQMEIKALRKKCECVVARVIYTASEPDAVEMVPEPTVVEEIIYGNGVMDTSIYCDCLDDKDEAALMDSKTLQVDGCTAEIDISINITDETVVNKVVTEEAAIQTEAVDDTKAVVLNDIAVQTDDKANVVGIGDIKVTVVDKEVNTVVCDVVAASVQTEEAVFSKPSGTTGTQCGNVSIEVGVAAAIQTETVKCASTYIQTEMPATVDIQTDTISSKTCQVQTDDIPIKAASVQTDSDDSFIEIEKHQLMLEAEKDARKYYIKDLINTSKELQITKDSLKNLEILNDELKADIAYFQDRLVYKDKIIADYECELAWNENHNRMSVDDYEYHLRRSNVMLRDTCEQLHYERWEHQRSRKSVRFSDQVTIREPEISLPDSNEQYSLLSVGDGMVDAAKPELPQDIKDDVIDLNVVVDAMEGNMAQPGIEIQNYDHQMLVADSTNNPEPASVMFGMEAVDVPAYTEISFSDTYNAVYQADSEGPEAVSACVPQNTQLQTNIPEWDSSMCNGFLADTNDNVPDVAAYFNNVPSYQTGQIFDSTTTFESASVQNNSYQNYAPIYGAPPTYGDASFLNIVSNDNISDMTYGTTTNNSFLANGMTSEADQAQDPSDNAVPNDAQSFEGSPANGPTQSFVDTVGATEQQARSLYNWDISNSHADVPNGFCAF